MKALFLIIQIFPGEWHILSPEFKEVGNLRLVSLEIEGMGKDHIIVEPYAPHSQITIICLVTDHVLVKKFKESIRAILKKKFPDPFITEDVRMYEGLVGQAKTSLN